MIQNYLSYKILHYLLNGLITHLKQYSFFKNLNLKVLALLLFACASIPASAYGGTVWKTRAHLDCCDDIFVMPHSNSVCATHGHLLEWNSYQNNGRAILGIPISGCVNLQRMKI